MFSSTRSADSRWRTVSAGAAVFPYSFVVPNSSRFFGWRIVALGVIANALGTGLIGVYGFMVTPLIEEFGATPAQLGLGMSITIVSMALVAPLLGPIFDRGPLRGTMLIGVGLMFSAVFLLSRAIALWQLGACLAFAAVGVSMFGMFPAKVLIVNWFVRKRGRALAIALTGTSLAALVGPPVTAWLIELATWRGAIVWIAGGGALIAVPAILAFAIRRPEDIGERPDGDASSEPLSRNESLLPETANGSFTREPNFWLIGVGDALAMCVPVAWAVFFVRHLEEVGIARTDIALVMPLGAAFSLLGKLTVGFLADRLDPRMLALATLSLHVSGIWIVALGDGIGSMILGIIPLGLGGGGFIPLPSIFQGRCFGRMVIGQVSGFHSLIGLPFMLASAPLTGFVASATGSFVTPFLVLGVVQILGMMAFALVRVPSQARIVFPPARVSGESS